ncbi:MAG TPA: rhomboid family intramembrane serine protease [Ktedonobacterales bacterium]|nr:rhomboid family intramembrane serine protease [Ktedonobacterales bacterium]
MIPLQDIDTPPRQSFPFVNTALILANVVVFIREATFGSAHTLNCFIDAYGFNPAVLTHHATVPATYISDACQGSGFALLPAWLTIFTAMFLHASILHIAGNMVFLFVFGDNVEDRLGHIGYLAFYLVCGVAAALAQTIAGPTANLPNLGASGAIAGVLGSYLLLFPRARVRTLVFAGILIFFTTISAILVILAWFILQLLDGYLSLASTATAQGGVAYFAHIGGFAAGFLITLAVKPFLPPIPSYYTQRRQGTS